VQHRAPSRAAQSPAQQQHRHDTRGGGEDERADRDSQECGGGEE
jgi:hypothetical protein